jgi:hypothetical protein
VGHQVIHARGVIWRGAQEHGREVQDLAKAGILDVLAGKGV